MLLRHVRMRYELQQLGYSLQQLLEINLLAARGLTRTSMHYSQWLHIFSKIRSTEIRRLATVYEVRTIS